MFNRSLNNRRTDTSLGKLSAITRRILHLSIVTLYWFLTEPFNVKLSLKYSYSLMIYCVFDVLVVTLVCQIAFNAICFSERFMAIRWRNQKCVSRNTQYKRNYSWLLFEDPQCALQIGIANFWILDLRK